MLQLWQQNHIFVIGNPVVIAISTNDALSGSAANIGKLINTNNVFFVPFRQDMPEGKPRSMISDFSKTEDAIICALKKEQLQPIVFG